MAINSNKVDRILEQLNESMMRAGEAAANAKPADITVLTQIVDDVHKLDGYYYVYDGSVKFKAYSDNVNYKVGQRVYVLIPQGDYSQQKLIQGRYFQPFDSVEFADEDFNDYYPLAPIKLSKTELTLEPTKEKTVHSLCTINGNPEINDKQYLALSFKLASNFGQNVLRNSYVFGLEVNLKFSSSETTSSKTIPDDVTYSLSSRDILGDPYNYLSWHLCRALIELPHYENENYRITQVNIAVKEQGPLTTLDGSALPESASFNLKDIEVSFGNKVNKIGDTIIISTLQGTDYDSAQKKESNQKDIYLSWMHSYVGDENKLNVIEFNDNNNPKADGSTLSYEDFDISNVIISWYQDIEYNANQYMENLQGEINFAENTLFDIVKRWSEANGISNWTSIEHNDAFGEKVLLETTDNSTDIEKWNIFTELVDNFRLTDANYSIKQDDNGVSSVKFYSSAVRKIKDALSSIDKNKIKLEQVKKEKDNNNPGQYTDGTRIRGETDYLLTYDPDETRQSCAVWVEMEIIYPDKSSKKLKSNKLEFKNAQQIPNQATVLAAAEVTINLADGSNGVYNLYDPNTNRLYSDLENKKRLMFVTCTDKDDNSIFMGQEIIIWQFPKKNTMLQLMDEDYLNYDETEDKENIYFCTKEVQGDLNSIKELFNNGNVKIDLDNYIYYGYKKPGSSRYISYKLNPYLNRDALNNEVKCYIIKNNTVLTGAITPLFRQHIVPSSRYRLEMSIGEKYDANFKKVDSESYSIIHGDDDWHKLDIKIFDNITNEERDLTLLKFSDIIDLWSRNEGFYSGFYTGWSTNNLTKQNGSYFIRSKIINNDELNDDLAEFRVLKGILPEDDTNDNSNCYIGYLPIPIKVKGENYSNYDNYKITFTYEKLSYSQSEEQVEEILKDTITKQDVFIKRLDPAATELEPLITKESATGTVSAKELLEALEINGHGIIGYDKDNANPTYFKEELKVICNNFENNLSRVKIELEKEKEAFESWKTKVIQHPERNWVALAWCHYKEFQRLTNEKNELEAKISAIQNAFKNNGWSYKIDLIARFGGQYKDSPQATWGPTLTYNRLRPKSQYIEHTAGNNEIAIEAIVEIGENEFARLYKPVAVIQNMDSTEMVVQGFEGGVITLTPRKRKEESIDGEKVLTIDNTATKIESTNLGLLKVNGSKQYSGIVMGNIVTQYPWEANENNLISALAGYRNNVQTFELNNNGNLYLGVPPTKEGHGGGLRFDGEKAVIEGGYVKEGNSNILKPGMTIDFNTGSIVTQKNMLIKSGGNLNIESGGDLSIAAGGKLNFEYDTGGSFIVKNNDNNNPAHIQLDDNGLDIKAKNITLNTGGDFILTAGSSSSITFKNNNSLTFKVDEVGNLTATSGSIAGWSILPNYFTSAQSMSGNTNQAGMAPFDKVYLSTEGGPLRVMSNSIAFWAGYTQLRNDPSGSPIKLLEYEDPARSPKFWVKYDGTVYASALTIGKNQVIGLGDDLSGLGDELSGISNNLSNYALKTDLNNYYSVEAAGKTEANIGKLTAKLREVITALNGLISPNQITNIKIADGLVVDDN